MSEQWIDNAIAQARFIAYCQPIFQVAPVVKNEPILYEVFIRLLTQSGEIVAAGDFIDLVTPSQLILIDRMMISWAFYHQFRTSVIHAINLSGHTLNDLTFPTWLHKELEKTGADPRLIHFEVTEQVMLEYLPSVQVLAALRDLKFVVGLDDLGIGYSGIQALIAVEPQFAKVDKSLVQYIEKSPMHYAIVLAILQGAAEMKIPVILEGIETGSIETTAINMAQPFPRLRLLTQGYLYGKPQACE